MLQQQDERAGKAAGDVRKAVWELGHRKGDVEVCGPVVVKMAVPGSPIHRDLLRVHPEASDAPVLA